MVALRAVVKRIILCVVLVGVGGCERDAFVSPFPCILLHNSPERWHFFAVAKHILIRDGLVGVGGIQERGVDCVQREDMVRGVRTRWGLNAKRNLDKARASNQGGCI